MMTETSYFVLLILISVLALFNKPLNAQNHHPSSIPRTQQNSFAPEESGTQMRFSDSQALPSELEFHQDEYENDGDLEYEFEREESDEKEERIETERHDFTQSTTVVGRGRTQVEFGYSFFQDSDDSEAEDSHATPEMLIRYGLSERWEFRVRYNEVWQFGEEDRQGSEDLHLAFKVRTSNQRERIPESALEIRFTTPTGGVDWSTDEIEFGLDYIYGWKLSPRAELYGSTGFSTNGLGEFSFATEDPAEEEFMLYTQSVALGVELNERTTIFYEFFGLFTDGLEDDDESPAFFNIGIDRYFGENIVFDIRAGTGLNEDAEDYFFGVGGGIRF